VSAQIVDLSEHRRVRELAAALAGMAEGRVEDLIVMQHLMIDQPDVGETLLRKVLSGRTSLAAAARAARRLLEDG